MNGQRPPRRGEPRSGESSLPHRQIESPTLWSGFLHLGLSHSLMPSEGRLGSGLGSTRGQDSPLGKSQAIRRVSARDGASQSGPTATFKARPDGRAFLLLGPSSPRLQRRVAVSPCRRRQSVRLRPTFPFPICIRRSPPPACRAVSRRRRG